LLTDLLLSGSAFASCLGAAAGGLAGVALAVLVSVALGSDFGLATLATAVGVDLAPAGAAAGLVFDGAGNLYGTTANCGTYGYGMAFQLKRNKNGS